MNVKQLREAMAGLPDDAPVYIAVPEGEWDGDTAAGIDRVDHQSDEVTIIARAV